MRINYIREISIKTDAKKDDRLSKIKNYCSFKLLKAVCQLSGRDHTILINEYQR